MIPKQATMNHPANNPVKARLATNKRAWTCERCGDKLPKSGKWHHRYVRWSRNPSRETSGYRCDGCSSGNTLADYINDEPVTDTAADLDNVLVLD